MFYRYWTNWGVYEEDIVFLGGSVEYSGSIVKKGWNYTVEKAVVNIMGNSCIAHMKRYDKERKSSAVLCCFEDRNGVVKDNLFPPAREFLFTLNDLAAENDDFLEYRFIREFKQYGTFALQFVCGIIFVCSLVKLLNSFSVGLLITAFLSFAIICIAGSLYKYYRMANLHGYKSKYFSTVDDDDTY